MEETEYEKAEKERRKQEVISNRNKKRFSALFMTIACIVEILITLVIIFAFIILVAVLVGRVLHLPEEYMSGVFSTLLIASLIGGCCLGFLIYKKLVIWAIKKFKLEDKLMKDVTSHYIRDSKDEINKKLKR